MSNEPISRPFFSSHRRLPRLGLAVCLAAVLLSGVRTRADAALGTFPTYVSVDRDSNISVDATLDFDGDGRTDVVTVDDGVGLLGSGVRLALRRGLPNGAFGLPVAFSVGSSTQFQRISTRFVLVGDFNGDGKDDVLAEAAPEGCADYCDQPTNIVRFQGGQPLSSGEVLFPSHRSYTLTSLVDAGSLRIGIGDLNNDGLSDIVQGGTPPAVVGGERSLRVHLTQIDGSVVTSSLGLSDTSAFSTVQSVGDADGGGVKNDIIATENRPDGFRRIVVHFNGATIPTALTPMSSVVSAFTPVAVGRTAAGLEPAVFTQTSRLCGNSQGTYLGREVQRLVISTAVASPTLPVATGWCASGVGDLDRNGLGDFVDISGFNTRPFYSKLFFRGETGVSEEIVLPAVAGREFRVTPYSGDVNGDGVTDLIAPVAIGIGTSPNIVYSSVIHTYLGPTSVVDLDADGVADSIDTGVGTFADPIDGQPTTVGAITSIPPGVTLFVSDAPDPDGVRVIVGGSGTAPAALTVCGFRVRLLPGSDVVLTCGSLRSKVIAGTMQVFLDEASSITIAAGSTVTVSTSGGIASVTTQAGTPPVIEDRTPPQLTAETPPVAEATSSAGAAVNFLVSAVDSLDGSVSVVCSIPSGSVFPIGSTSVSCSATDASGNEARASFDVRVADSMAPTVAMTTDTTSVVSPSSVTLRATAVDTVGVSRVEFLEGANVLATGTSAPFAHTLTFTTSDNGSHTYRVRAVDNAGNIAWSETVSIVVDIPVGPQSDLVASLDAVPATFRPGATTGYAVLVRNRGAAPSSGPVTITDVLPAALSYVGVVAPGWRCQIGGATLTCTTLQPVGAGRSLGFALLVRVGSTVPVGTTITNTVIASPTDSTPQDNVATKAVSVRR